MAPLPTLRHDQVEDMDLESRNTTRRPPSLIPRTTPPEMTFRMTLAGNQYIIATPRDGEDSTTSTERQASAALTNNAGEDIELQPLGALELSRSNPYALRGDQIGEHGGHERGDSGALSQPLSSPPSSSGASGSTEYHSATS